MRFSLYLLGDTILKQLLHKSYYVNMPQVTWSVKSGILGLAIYINTLS